MHPHPATAATTPLLAAAPASLLGLLLGVALGVALREAVQAAGHEAHAREWVRELLAAGVLSLLLGVVFARTADTTLVSLPFGAGLTTYAAAPGAHGYLDARTARREAPGMWAAAHFIACLAAGTAGFAIAILVTSTMTP